MLIGFPPICNSKGVGYSSYVLSANLLIKIKFTFNLINSLRLLLDKFNNGNDNDFHLIHGKSMSIDTNIDFTDYFAISDSQPFKDRQATMPWRSSQPIAPPETPQTWSKLLQQHDDIPACKRLVYIHIPFCETRCTFCGFYQNKYHPDLAQQYVRALMAEIMLEAQRPLYQRLPIHTVYLGGGTPSALTAHQLADIIATLTAVLPLAPDCEITIEGRILSFSDDKIDACLDAGVNRFSLGIQTFDSRIRKRLARTSTGEQARHFLEKLVARDRAAVVCDLLFGLPQQTEQSWQQDLYLADQIGLDGVDLYALNILPNTALAKAITNQRLAVPSATACQNMYLYGSDYLAELGWQMISNSHFARTTRERNLYNLLIKEGAECFAFGSGAGGAINGYSYMNERNLERYIAAIEDQQKPLMMMTYSAASAEQWRVSLQSGVEKGRIPLDKIIINAQLLQPLLSQWHQAGLLYTDSSCMRLTNKGRFWSSQILRILQELLLKVGVFRAPPTADALIAMGNA